VVSVLLTSRSVEEPSESSAAPRRLVVLPLASPGSEAPEADLAGQMTEELVAQLGAELVPEMGVLARSTSLRLRSQALSISELRDRFGVDYVVEGAVVRQNDRLRASIQLVRSEDEAQIWAHLFERPWNARFHLPAEVGREVAQALALEMPALSDRPRPWSRITPPEAYSRFLTAQLLLSLSTPDGDRAARDQLDLALEQYPDLAPAHCALGEIVLREAVHPSDKVPRARLAVEKALALDPNLPSAWLLKGRVQMLYEWELSAATASIDRALELSPSLAAAHQARALLLSAEGRNEEAIAEQELARSLDPLSPAVNTDVAWLYFVARKFEAAEASARIGTMGAPRHMGPHLMLFNSLFHQGKHEAALEQANDLLRLTGARPEPIPGSSKELTDAALRDFSRRRFKFLLRLRKQFFVPPGELGFAAAALGEDDLALDFFEEAIEERSDWRALWFRQDPRFDPIRELPRARQILERISKARG